MSADAGLACHGEFLLFERKRSARIAKLNVVILFLLARAVKVLKWRRSVRVSTIVPGLDSELVSATALPPDVRRWLCPAVEGLLMVGLCPLVFLAN
jgi:hypothetical protein